MKNLIATFSFLIMSFIAIGQTETVATIDSNEVIELQKGDALKFVLVNNSLKFMKTYVIGPKANGGSFSYGLDLSPFQRNTERWTVGTKLYARNKSCKTGRLIYEFTAADNGKVIKIK